MLPVAFRLSSAPRPHRIVSTAPNLRNDETPGLAPPSRFFEESRARLDPYQKLVVVETIGFMKPWWLSIQTIPPEALFCSFPSIRP